MTSKKKNKPTSIREIEREWKKLAKINFDGLSGMGYGVGELELRVYLLGLVFYSRQINLMLGGLRMEIKVTPRLGSPKLGEAVCYNKAVQELNAKIDKLLKEKNAK